MMRNRSLLMLAGIAALFLLCSCAPTLLPQRPAENYKGPIAEGPILQSEDYWIYRRADGTRIKLGAGNLLSKMEFPLWVGKVWRFQGTATLQGQPVTGHRIPTEIECEAVAFRPVTVAAGTFEAFECQCRCTVTGGPYDPWCGDWTIWYAPQVKNIARMKTESTASTVELLEYKISDPKAEAFYNSGNAYLSKKDYDRAIQDYNEAIRLNPNYTSAFNNRGNVYRDKKDYDHAIQDYDKAIRLNPNYALAFNNRGIAYRNIGDYDHAIQDYSDAIRLNPNYVDAFNNRGNVYRDKRDYDRAIQDYNQAVQLNPSYALAFNNRAIAYLAKKDYDRSLADREAAARIDPKAANHRSMSHLLFYLSRFEQSAEATAQALKASPQNMYMIIWRYMAQAKSTNLEIASRELGLNAAGLEKRAWPAPVIDYYLGKITEQEVYAAAEHPDPKKKGEHICEANFYAAEAKLLKRAAEEAIPLLRAAEKECPPTFYEAHGARAELKRLGQ